MRVRELMSTDLVTVPATADMETVAERMLYNQVGSAIVTDDGTPCGIVTETDALTVGYAADKPLSEVSVVAAMSNPLTTIQPTVSIRDATDRMIDEQVKKLPVVDDLDVEGIITMTDIIRNHSDLVKEAKKIERGRGSHDPKEWRSIDE